MAEYQPSKLRVAGSRPVSRSILCFKRRHERERASRGFLVFVQSPYSSGVERTLGKGEAVSSSLTMGFLIF